MPVSFGDRRADDGSLDMVSGADDGVEHNTGDGEIALNRRECPHCALWFRLDEAKTDGMGKCWCPYCGWQIQSAG
ncbi:MAG: hypothetical protein HQL22_03465 [Candidatus Omnitrophica bacterium]|nr:hypothetical protein [Candidatus Omnitrophota bacterium]